MSNQPQTLRFRRPETKTSAVAKPKWQDRHAGLLQDQLRRSDRPPWSPSFSLAFRIVFLVRFAAAMYSNIDDCDEVYNFWEPLHFFDKGYGFQTWEVTPQYAIRSWAYIILHLLPVRIASSVFGDDKRPAFFALRVALAAASTFSEVYLYRQVYEKVNNKVGRYLFFMLVFSAGMWNASTAFLPSSFAMYMSTFAFASSIAPASNRDSYRTTKTTVLFAAGAIIGWPFALALSVPFILEELFVFGGDTVPSVSYVSWITARWKRLFRAAAVASLVLIPVIGIDSLAYGRLAIVPWNIVQYNIFSDRGPNLYGTSPWNFYILNLLLNFNVLVPFAFVSLPTLFVTYFVDRKRLGFITPSSEQSSPFALLGIRLMPFYLWTITLSLQEHKEERFMFPVYPLLCFNAAVAVYLIRGWMEVAFITLTKSPYQAGQSSIFRSFTSSVILLTTLISASRILALWHYYHAPMSLMHTFEYRELPRLLNDSGVLPPTMAPSYKTSGETRETRIDLTPIKSFDLTLCIGKEWYRFPGHYLVPSGVRVDFIKSEFEGLLPGHFLERPNETAMSLWPRPETRFHPQAVNDRNFEEPSNYVDIGQCDYLMDLDFPEHPTSSVLEPRYATFTDTWQKVECRPFLDARHSPLLGRALWVPGQSWEKMNSWGEYCLLRNEKKVASKVKSIKAALSENL